MEIIDSLVLWPIFGFVWWLSIRVIAGQNSKNSIALAAIISFSISITMPVMGVFMFTLPLIALGYLLVRFYDIDLFRSACIILIVGAGFALYSRASNHLRERLKNRYLRVELYNERWWLGENPCPKLSVLEGASTPEGTHVYCKSNHTRGNRRSTHFYEEGGKKSEERNGHAGMPIFAVSWAEDGTVLDLWSQ